MPLQKDPKFVCRKRKRAEEAAPTRNPESPPPPSHAKRRKPSSQSRGKPSPDFWDSLSLVPMCRRALREFNRRAVRPIPPRQHTKRDVEDSLVKQLQRFARRGGPDLRSIRGYPEQIPLDKMRSNRGRSSRSSRFSARDSNTKPTTLSSKDAAFEQELIDNAIYPPGYDHVKPGNLEEILEKLGQPRASLSPSKFSNDDFLHFSRKNDEAGTEAEVMSQVFPLIVGKTPVPSGYNQVFNLDPLSVRISNPQPDYYNGSRPAQIYPKVRNDLEHYIIPSTKQHRCAVPNFFTEAKGPDGKASVAKRQITQDLAVGARGMFKMQCYELDEPVFDNEAYTFGSIYHGGTGTLQLYAMHPTKPEAANGRPEYHTTKIRGFDLTDDLDTHRQGIGAWRNLRDLAKGKRNEFISLANERADNEDERANGEDEPESASASADLTSFPPTSQSSQSKLFASDTMDEESETSMDELAISAPPTKRRKKHKKFR